mgnify:CR=1 FL=1
MSNKVNEIYEILLKDEILEIGSFILKNNIKTEYYINSQKMYSNVPLMNMITDKIINKINTITDLEYDHLVGVPYGALPLVSLLSNKLDKSMIFMHKDKKGYGSKKMIEGKYEIGDNVILIEDTITTGSSIIDTITKLENCGIFVSYVLVLFDRETGALNDIKETLNIHVDSLFKISKMSHYFSVKQLINQYDGGKIISSIGTDKKNYLYIKEDNKRLNEEENQRQLSIKKYEYIFNNPLSTLLIGLVIRKKTALCLSLDVSSWKTGRNILELCGPYICMVKLHSDLFTDIGNINMFIKELKELARKYKFLIMEDMKLGDVDKITYRKIKNSFFKYEEWANLITIHGITANSVYEYSQQQTEIEETSNKKKSSKKKKEIKKKVKIIEEIDDAIKHTDNVSINDVNVFGDIDRELYFNNLCMVSSMNQKNSLCDENYNNQCYKLLRDNNDFSSIIVSQNGNKVDDRIKLTPGVSINCADITNLNRNYRSIKEAINEDKNHIIIVGNDIISSYKEIKNKEENKRDKNKEDDNNQDEFIKKTRLYCNISWKYFSETYDDLIIKYNSKNIDISHIYDSIFSMTQLEEKIYFKEIEYNEREEEIVKKQHELFIKQNGYNVQQKELQNQTKDFMYSQYVSYTLFTLLTIIVNYKQIINYLN